jgi:ZIP family zinc transporter
MLVLSLLAFSISVPEKVVAAMQHLAAGIVLSAVSIELVPEIMRAPNDAATIAGMTVGFVAGITLFLAVGKFCTDGDEDGDDDMPPDKYAEAAEPMTVLAMRRNSAKPPLGVVGRMRTAQLVEHYAVPKLFPINLLIAVGTDALVDGLLIGIASVNGGNAGVVMAIALSIEMGFLGLTFGTTMATLRRSRACLLCTVILPPLLLAVGGAFGGLLASLLEGSPALHTGLLSFGVAALLYLVTEELLIEAHSGHTSEHTWWVDLQFFVGFFLSMLVEKYVR